MADRIDSFDTAILKEAFSSGSLHREGVRSLLGRVRGALADYSGYEELVRSLVTRGYLSQTADGLKRTEKGDRAIGRGPGAQQSQHAVKGDDRSRRSKDKERHRKR